MRIAAIVVTFNRKALLAACLDALVRQSRPPDEVLVVDNASSDGTAALVQRDWGDRVRLRTLGTNEGGAGGFAAGLAWAQSLGVDWSWMMDDDARPAPGALEALCGPMAERQGALVALCSRVLSGGPEAVGGRDAPSTCEALAVGGRPDLEDVPQALFVGYAVNRRTVQVVGLPRADFFIYTDDTEYCMRIRRAGGRVLRVGRSVVWHADWKADAANRAVRLFGRRIVVDPAIPGWKRYYLARNRLLIGRQYGLGYLAQAACKSALLVCATALFRPRDLPLAVRGALHGLAGISGATVRPREKGKAST